MSGLRSFLCLKLYSPYFLQLRMRKKDCYAYQNVSYLCCLYTRENVLSLETSSEINFEFIKFVKTNVKCLPLTKTNREY